MDKKYAGFWIRLAALLVDIVVIILISIGLGLIVGISTAILGLNPSISNLISQLISYFLWFLYAVVYQSKTGQTFGKKVVGIKIVDSNGNKPSMLVFFLREIIGKFISGLILCIGYLMVIWDPKKQGLHDKIAGTYVVRV